jgi:hypothetical protein
MEAEMRARLKTLISRNELVDVERLPVSDDDLTGRILRASDRFVYMMRFDDEGRYDGVSVMRTEDVTRVRWGAAEHKTLSHLIAQHGKPPQAPTIGLESFEPVIRALDEHFGCVELHPEILDDDVRYIGELGEIDSEAVVLHEYGRLGSLDRFHVLHRLTDVTRVDADTIYTRDLLSLYESRSED